MNTTPRSKVGSNMKSRVDQCSPQTKSNVLNFLARKRTKKGGNGNTKYQTKNNASLSSSLSSFLNPTGKELNELRKKVKLLHSFLPQEIIETIQRNWSRRSIETKDDDDDDEDGGKGSSDANKKNGGNRAHKRVDSVTACSTILSYSEHSSSVPQSIFIHPVPLQTTQDEKESVQLEQMVIKKNDNAKGEDVSVISGFDSNANSKHHETTRRSAIISTSSTACSSRALYSEEADDVCIVFANIVDFDKISKQISPSEVLDMLQNLFHRFDVICDRHNVLKLDTIGDAYLCCTGHLDEETSSSLPSSASSSSSSSSSDNRGQCSALRVLEAAKEMVREAGNVPIPKSSSSSSSSPQEYLRVKIGIHIGDATFGVLGQLLPKLVCVGSAVNMAARMEQTCDENMIHVTKDFYEVVGDKEQQWEFSETVQIKNMGEVETYLLDPLKGEDESQWC